MTKVSVNEDAKPSQEIVKAALTEIVVTDDRGRKLGLRKPGILAQTRLPKVLGPELAKNTVYMELITPILFVASIDGRAIPYPMSDREIEATLEILDEDGMAAVMKGVVEHFGAPSVEAEKADVKK